MIARLTFLAMALSFALTLGGCDAVTALMADPKAAQRIADAKAIGSACRHGLRSIEDCYMLNEKASKSAVFTGWKDMDQYMRENKVEGIPAKIEKPLTPPPAPVVPIEEVLDAPAKPASGH